jgi:hypothetical protein
LTRLVDELRADPDALRILLAEAACLAVDREWRRR